MSSELSELVQDCGVAQVQVLCNVLEIPVVSSVVLDLRIGAFLTLFLKNLCKNLIHLKQFFLGNQGPNFPFFLSFFPPDPSLDPLDSISLGCWWSWFFL